MSIHPHYPLKYHPRKVHYQQQQAGRFGTLLREIIGERWTKKSLRARLNMWTVHDNPSYYKKVSASLTGLRKKDNTHSNREPRSKKGNTEGRASGLRKAIHKYHRPSPFSRVTLFKPFPCMVGKIRTGAYSKHALLKRI